MQVPETWELLQFTRNPEAGRCAFADRYDFRLEFSWRKVAGAPDFERMLSDYTSQLQGQGEGVEVTRTRRAGWQGIEARTGPVASSRFGRFFPTESCLVELVFLWPGDKDAALMERVLKSVREERERADGRRRWRAFGMDLLADGTLPFSDCRAEPAHAAMTFGEEESRPHETFSRLGMVAEWLHQPVEAWVRSQLPLKAEAGTAVQRTVEGHAITRVEAKEKVVALRGLLGGWVRHAVEAWICPADERLYAVWVCKKASVGEAEPELGGRRLCCCDALRRCA